MCVCVCVCVAESNGKLLHLLIPSKTEFAVEDLSLGRTAALVPELPVKDLPLGFNDIRNCYITDDKQIFMDKIYNFNFS